MVADEQGCGREQDDRGGEEGRAAQGVGALAGDVVQAEQGEGDARHDGPDRQGHGAQAADPGQQHQGQEGDDQQQGAEQQGLGRGPDLQIVVGAAVQPEQAEALQQADAQPDRAQQGGRGAAEAVAAGGFGGLGHDRCPSMRGCEPVSTRLHSVRLSSARLRV